MSDVPKDAHSRSSGRQKHHSATTSPPLLGSISMPTRTASMPNYIGVASILSAPDTASSISGSPSPTSALYASPQLNNDRVNDDFMGILLGVLGGITTLVILIITFFSIRRANRQQRHSQRPESPSKRGWGVRESWYSETLSICPSTLPPPYYCDSEIYSNPKKEPLSPPLQSPTATLQYSNGRTHVLEHTMLKVQTDDPSTRAAAATITPKPTPNYSPQLAFSPSFNTSMLVRNVNPDSIAMPPPPFQTQPQQQLASLMQPPSPTATKSTPQYSPQLTFSPSLYTSNLVNGVQLSSGQNSTVSSSPVPQASGSTRSPDITDTEEMPHPKPSRSTIRSYQAQLNKDI
ncbi:hypothetical protein BX666DRAFT_865052 [Dichotomocladium elegans]|nr:hypothetical protein BX666DRAFT_865052 [Dichotomocladium elegans]